MVHGEYMAGGNYSRHTRWCALSGQLPYFIRTHDDIQSFAMGGEPDRLNRCTLGHTVAQRTAFMRPCLDIHKRPPCGSKSGNEIHPTQSARHQSKTINQFSLVPLTETAVLPSCHLACTWVITRNPVD
jgi:hypothetical protein